jgi:hypothetical protein
MINLHMLLASALDPPAAVTRVPFMSCKLTGFIAVRGCEQKAMSLHLAVRDRKILERKGWRIYPQFKSA